MGNIFLWVVPLPACWLGYGGSENVLLRFLTKNGLFYDLGGNILQFFFFPGIFTRVPDVQPIVTCHTVVFWVQFCFQTLLQPTCWNDLGGCEAIFFLSSNLCRLYMLMVEKKLGREGH